MNKEEVGTRYLETMARKYCMMLLKQDRQALMRVFSQLKLEIFKEEATMEMEEAIKKARK